MVAGLRFMAGMTGAVSMRFWVVLLSGLAGVMAATMPAAAQGPQRAPTGTTDWTLTLGVEGRVLPTYQGSDDYTFMPSPLIDVRRAGTPRRFRSPDDGASFGLFETSTFRIGPTVRVRRGRDADDDSSLRGMGDVDWTIEPGLFAEFWPMAWLRTRAEVRHGFGGHEGWVSDLTADIVVPVTSQLTLSGGPRLRLADADALNPYFGVTAAQSAASGLPAYSAGGGVQYIGVGAMARYEWSPQWATHFFVEYTRLQDDAADSPLVALRGSPDQVQIGIGASYSFDIPGLW